MEHPLAIFKIIKNIYIRQNEDMKKNKKVNKYLTKQRDEYQKKFNSFSKVEKIFAQAYSELKQFDLEGYKLKLEKEIQENLKEWWINPKKGILMEEELISILFEYGHFFAKEVEAESYGIGKWKNYKVQTEEFDMGNDYDFTTAFYAAPGLSLDFFDPLEKLDYSNLSKKYAAIEIDELEGYNELIELFKFTGMLAIQEVFQKMDINKEFETLNYRHNFMFIIDEHDSGEVYPLLIKEKTER